MNLPANLKAVLDANSGAAIAKKIGEVWNKVEAPGAAAQVKSGGEIIKLDAKSKAAFDAVGAKVVDRWIKESKSQGFDGKALVDAARASIAKYSK